MKLRLTRPAARQLERVLSEIAGHHPLGARNVQRRIRSVMDMLLQQPHAGPMTTRRNVRRMVVRPYPYAITYSVGEDEIIILGIRHTARQPLAGSMVTR